MTIDSRQIVPSRLVLIAGLFAVVALGCVSQNGGQPAVPENAVIAHRGLSHWAPEETLPSYVLARELGVDYLEADLQRTKDGRLICLHDVDLKRTTDISTVFPDRQHDPANTFTLAELKTLDAGSWFNADFPERARKSFVGLRILTLDELIDIAEGGGADMPGICLETKQSSLFPGIENDLHRVLSARGWDGSDPRRRLLLQTFEASSLEELNRNFPDVPKVLLLWKDPEDKEDVDRATYETWLDFAVAHGARFVGPSIPLPPPKNYANLMEDWMVELISAKQLRIIAYTVNSPDQFETYVPLTHGLFTDRADLLLAHHRVQKLLEGTAR